MKCNECGGELKPKVDFFKQNGDENLIKMREKFKKEYGHELPMPKGYNCINCGACYDENFKKEEFRIGWLGGKKNEYKFVSAKRQ